MRLLLVTNDYPPKPGGIQQYLANLIGAYPHPSLVIAPADSASADEPDIVRSGREWMLPTPATARWIADRAVQFEPDVVLFGAPHPLPALGPYLRRRLGVPIGVISHGAEVTLPAAIPGVRQALATVLRRADVVFAVSRFTGLRVAGITGRDVRYLGAGVDLQTFSPVERSGARRPVMVGCVSRFVPRKGQHRLLGAVAEVRGRGLDVAVLLVGRGRKEPALRRLADRLGVPVRFEVDVPWARLPDLYGDMDVFCMPCRSRWFGLEVEGLGLVYLEAAATGLPVIAGDSGGAPETVAPGQSGYVVHSTADIVDAITLLVEDPARALRMGGVGIDRVAAEFTWDKVARRLIDGFAAAIRGGGSIK